MMFTSRRWISTICGRSLRTALLSLRRTSKLQDKCISCATVGYVQVRGAKKPSFTSLFEDKPKPSAGKTKKTEVENSHAFVKSVIVNLSKFIRKPEIMEMAVQQGMNAKQARQAFASFRQHCLCSPSLELKLIFEDMEKGVGHPDDLFPYYISHAMELFPQIASREELRKISDLRSPATWYPLARATNRKIVFHAGPTNSGKTHHALQQFFKAKRSVYCGPLKMLATEVFNKANAQNVVCDLVTGEERKQSGIDGQPSDRVSCTVEMTPVNISFDVAVIDEIQMIQDPARGWAWTRALLGVAANEIHLCGEEAAVPIVSELLESAGEVLEVKKYQRLTPLHVEETALQDLSNVQPGDCIVCFRKKDIFTVAQKLENLGKEVAVVYGSLPPGVKAVQASRFNSEVDSCSVLVATDAIGMGLNLNIRRMIFYSVEKMDVCQGKRRKMTISVSQALQIAGRAGRYGSSYGGEGGYVTTFLAKDLKTLRKLLRSTPAPVLKAGLHPTAEQIEMFSYHLPEKSLHGLLETFTEVCRMDDSLFFLCEIETFKFLADELNEISLSLRSRYMFCCAPVNITSPYITAMFVKMVRCYSNNRAMGISWLKKQLEWPFQEPCNLFDLITLECIHDVLELFLWLSFRFPDYFKEVEEVLDLRKNVDELILTGIVSMNKLIKLSVEIGSPTRSKKVDTGPLSQRLLSKGVITEEMWLELRKEFINETKNPTG